MTARSLPETSSDAADPSWWGAILVGAIFIFAGLFVLGDVAAATVISTFLIAVLLVVAGAAEVFQAFLCPTLARLPCPDAHRTSVCRLWADAHIRSCARVRHPHFGIRVISDCLRLRAHLPGHSVLGMVRHAAARLRHRGDRCRACHSCKVAGQRPMGSGSSSGHRSPASRSLVDLAGRPFAPGTKPRTGLTDALKIRLMWSGIRAAVSLV